MTDYQVLTGFPVAHSWQQQHGSIPAGRRLVPGVPLCWGESSTRQTSMPLMPSKECVWRGSLAVQIRDLPDGATVVYQPGD